jgi:signal peptidase I
VAAPATPHDEQAEHTPNLARELPVLIIAAGIIAFLVKTLVAQAFYIPSGSMLPQLQINDRVVVSKVSYHLHDPHRGDIVVFDAPRIAAFPRPEPKRNPVANLIHKIGTGVGVIQPSTEEFIKRVIGLPGERIDIKDGHVYVNGHELVEPYLPPGTVTLSNSAKLPVTLLPGQVWVMGDNRGNSSDSRFFGPIPEKTIVGRTILRVWPPGKMSFL